MAGSYRHVTMPDGAFRDGRDGFYDQIENLGDAYECIEEMHWMIWHLAGGKVGRIRSAENAYYASLHEDTNVAEEEHDG